VPHFNVAGTSARGKGSGASFERRRETFARVFQALVQGNVDMQPLTDRLTFKQLRDIAAFLDVSTKFDPSSSY
jgi:hypothetical protein